MRYLFIACLLAGCMPGPSAETLVDELRVIAAVAEPPEVMPAETSNLEVVVADPLQNGAQVAVWACTPAGEDTCVEAGSPLAGRLATGTLDDGRFFADITVNPAWAAFAGPEPVPAPIWVLACEPGLCEPLAQMAEAEVAGEADEALERLLATPTEWVADLPLTGVSLGAKSLYVSTRMPGERNENPTLTVDGDLVSAPGEELTLEVSVEDTETVAEVVGLSTAGGFGLPAFSLLDGRGLMRWYAPEEPVDVRLYAVATDGAGGTAVWTGQAIVQ